MWAVVVFPQPFAPLFKKEKVNNDDIGIAITFAMEVLVYKYIRYFNIKMFITRISMLVDIFKTSGYIEGNLQPSEP